MHKVQEKYNLSSEVKFCKECTMSNQRPRITFDEHGVCSACNYSKKKASVNWEEREEKLRALLDKYRSKKGYYDVIVPCSGGKDSSYVAHQLKYVYNMHPLTVNFPPNIYTNIGWQNLQNFIRAGFDNITGTPNREIYRIMSRLAFEHLGDNFQPFVYGVKALPIRIAVNYRVPLVMYAENGEVEYGGAADNEDSAMHNLSADLVKHYFSGMPPEAFEKYNIGKTDLLPYTLPALEEIEKVGVQCHFFGYYKKWVPQENFYYAQKHTGFQVNSDGRSEGTYSKYASLDDKTDGFHYYLSYIKFGIGRATSDAAHEIRDGHITREEGVGLVRRYDGEFPKKYFREFLEYNDLTEERFWEIVDSFRSPHLWQKENGEWKLKKVIWEDN